MTYDAITICIRTCTELLKHQILTQFHPSRQQTTPSSHTPQKPKSRFKYNSPPSTLYTRNNKSKTPKMSAPNSGRQSPPPEKQTGAQQQDPVASGHTQHGIHGDSKGASEDTKLHGLESNPKHPLEDIEAKKFEKGTGN
ncbi:hypothetical protein AFLA_008035 [Aspergillus flavus NRRL3357]|nr:hypothetical protein AFLA_008035 [Aspergillus flavus NRRL3357]